MELGTLIGYTNLVKLFAADLNDEQLIDSNHICESLENVLHDWNWEDWYSLLKAVRREKYQEEYKVQTAEKVLNDMPFFARAVAQECVTRLLKASREDRLYKLDKEADSLAEILWKMFYCDVMKIKAAAEQLNKISPQITYNEFLEHKRLLCFMELLREELWKQGEILILRDKE